MSQVRTLRIRDVGAYLGVSHQRADRMLHEGKLPEPERVDGIGPLWEARDDRALGRAGVVGFAVVEGSARARPLPVLR